MRAQSNPPRKNSRSSRRYRRILRDSTLSLMPSHHEKNLVAKIVEESADSVTIRLGGYLEAVTYDELDFALEEFFQAGVKTIIIDLSEMEYISSTGISVFIEMLDVARENGGSIRFTNLSPKVSKIFALLNVLVDSTEADAEVEEPEVDEG